MAVAIDAVSTSGTPATGISITWDHTTSGSPTGVGIGIAWRDANANINVDVVTYGGFTCTLEDTQAFESNITKVALYSLANPPSGTQTVEVFFTASADRKSAAYAVSVTGGSTSDVFSAVSKATASSFTASVDVTSDTDELVMDICAKSPSTSTSETIGANQTQRLDVSLNGAGAYGSTEPGAATVTMSWVFGSSSPWGIVAGSFSPSGGTGTEPLTTSLVTGSQGTETPSHTVAL